MPGAVTADTARDRALFNTVPLLVALEPKDRDALWGLSRARRCSGGGVIVCQGAPADTVLFLLSGSATSVVSMPHGRTVTIATWCAPSVLDKVAVFAGTLHPGSIMAKGSVSWRAVPSAALHAVLDSSPDARRHVVRMVAMAAQDARASLVEIVAKSSLSRVASWLLGDADERGVAIIASPQEQLAATLGMTRVTLNRNLRQLSDEGMISRDQKLVRLRDVSRLRALSDR